MMLTLPWKDLHKNQSQLLTPFSFSLSFLCVPWIFFSYFRLQCNNNRISLGPLFEKKKEPFEKPVQIVMFSFHFEANKYLSQPNNSLVRKITNETHKKLSQFIFKETAEKKCLRNEVVFRLKNCTFIQNTTDTVLICCLEVSQGLCHRLFIFENKNGWEKQNLVNVFLKKTDENSISIEMLAHFPDEIKLKVIGRNNTAYAYGFL